MSSRSIIFVASDSEVIADTVIEQLETEFTTVQRCVHYQAVAIAQMFLRSEADVILLAYQSLDSTIHLRKTLIEVCHKQRATPFHTVTLCNKASVEQAYQLSKQRFFYDYVVFWPLSYDPYRLIMSVHQALDDLGYNADIQQQRYELETKKYSIKAITQLVEQMLAEQKTKKSELNNLIESALKKLNQAVLTQQKVAAHNPLVAMVIDDDEFQCLLLKKMLENEGYIVHQATTGMDALEQLNQVHPDIILLDVFMPDMSGIETLRQLKNEPTLEAIPVIMVSGHHEKEVVLDCIMLGAVNYLVKPIDKETLRAHLPFRL
ncbi:response regulator [Nitrincola sp.]|uniref:response regulator n=1 Tax=Nitrincola sp. TaxID=1926584 RepID=UPI003A8FFB34